MRDSILAWCVLFAALVDPEGLGRWIGRIAKAFNSAMGG